MFLPPLLPRPPFFLEASVVGGESNQELVALCCYRPFVRARDLVVIVSFSHVFRRSVVHFPLQAQTSSPASIGCIGILSTLHHVQSERLFLGPDSSPGWKFIPPLEE